MSWSEARYDRWLKDVEIREHIADLVPDDFDKTEYFGKMYWKFEERVINYLRSKNWELINNFETSDGDSFGPLMRLAKMRNPEGKIVEISHG